MRLILTITLLALAMSACEVDNGTRLAMPGQTVIISLADGTTRMFLVPPNHKYIVRKFTSGVYIEDYTPPTSVIEYRRIYTVENRFAPSIEIQ
jgi:hypothetical protein